MPLDPNKLIAETILDIAENANRQHNASGSAQDEKVKQLIEDEINSGPAKTKKDYYRIQASQKAAEFIERNGGDSGSYKDWTEVL